MRLKISYAMRINGKQLPVEMGTSYGAAHEGGSECVLDESM